MTRVAALILVVAGAAGFIALVTNGHPAIGFAVLVAASCAAIVFAVTAFVRDPDDWPDDVPRFPPD